MGCKLEAEGRVRQAGERTSGITKLGATGPGPGNGGRCGAVSAIAPSSASSQHRPCSQDQARDVNTGIQPQPDVKA